MYILEGLILLNFLWIQLQELRLPKLVSEMNYGSSNCKHLDANSMRGLLSNSKLMYTALIVFTVFWNL